MTEARVRGQEKNIAQIERVKKDKMIVKVRKNHGSNQVLIKSI
jgi:hypothetical protein